MNKEDIQLQFKINTMLFEMYTIIRYKRRTCFSVI